MENDFILNHNNLTIPCKLTVPKDGVMKRIVLGVHGLGGSAGDAIQAAIAEEMELFYAATLRFDFPAHGNSPMGSSDLTLENCISSLICAANYAKTRFPEIEDLCIFATGFGAYVTLIALQKLLEMPGRIRLVVQTPSIMMHDTLLAMANISRETFWAMERFTFRSKRPFDVTYHFYEELQESPALTTYPIPILILHGEDDKYIRKTDIQNFHRINEHSQLVIIPGTTHQFMEAGAWDMVLDLTRDWFEFGQVLLDDWN